MHWYKPLSHGIIMEIILKTQGLDADQMEAAIQATIKMLNLIEDKELNIQDN